MPGLQGKGQGCRSGAVERLFQRVLNVDGKKVGEGCVLQPREGTSVRDCLILREFFPGFWINILLGRGESAVGGLRVKSAERTRVLTKGTEERRDQGDRESQT